MITDAEIAIILARLEQTLRDIGFAVNTGACKCGRCERKAAPAPAVAAEASAPGPVSGGTLVVKPAPAPRAPRPGGIAVRLPVLEIPF